IISNVALACFSGDARSLPPPGCVNDSHALPPGPVVLVEAAPPDAGLVTPPWGCAVRATGTCPRSRPVRGNRRSRCDGDAVLEHERTHAHGSPNASPRTLTQTATRRRYHVRPPACQSLHSANQAEWPGGVWRTAETHRALDHLGSSHYAPSFVMTGSGGSNPSCGTR